MISFGELRRKSIDWKMEISAVEKIYARDWLLKGIFDRPALRENLILRGPSALAGAYFADYPRVEEMELARSMGVDDPTLAQELEAAAADATVSSGLQFRLERAHATEAHFEFIGPLGRRSASQPTLTARFVTTPPRTAPLVVPLVHPFSDTVAANVRALSLIELTAQRIVRYAQKPRSQDVFDLWFILDRDTLTTDREPILDLAATIAREFRVTLTPTLNPSYAPQLEQSWDNALKHIPNHPPFAEAQRAISIRLADWQNRQE